MLPLVEIIKLDEYDFLLMQSPDLITNSLKRTGRWDKISQEVCKLAISREASPVVLDLGANLGSFSIPIAIHLRERQGRIVCVEPQRIVFQQLCANLFLNRIDNAYTHNIALGNHSETIKIPELDFHKSKNVGGFSLEYLEKQQESGGLKNEINADAGISVTNMELLDDLHIPGKIAFVKIDVEGHELEAFQGGAKTLKSHGYPPILFEMWDHDWYEEKANATRQFLIEMGYNIDETLDDNVLAQHPSRPFYLTMKKEDKSIKLSLRARNN